MRGSTRFSSPVIPIGATCPSVYSLTFRHSSVMSKLIMRMVLLVQVVRGFTPLPAHGLRRAVSNKGKAGGWLLLL